MSDFTTAGVEARPSMCGLPAGTAGIVPPVDPQRHGQFLTDVIVELGLASRDEVEVAERAARENELPIEQALLAAGALDEEQLARVIAERNGLDYVDLEAFEIEPAAAELVGRAVAERYEAAPIAFTPDGALVIAVRDVFDTFGATDIGELARSEVRRVVAAPGPLRALIERLPAEGPPAPEPEAPEPVPAPVDAEAPLMDAEAPVPPPVEAEAPSVEPATAEAEEEEETPFEDAPVEEVEPTFEQAMPPAQEPTLDQMTPPLQVISEPVEMHQAPEAPAEPQGHVEAVPLPPVEPESAPEAPEPIPSDAELADLVGELRALREAASRADALAVRVGDRIEALEGAAERVERLEREKAERDERLAQLQRDLDAAKATSAELEGRLAGVGDAAEELNAATEKLRELQRALAETAR